MRHVPPAAGGAARGALYMTRSDRPAITAILAGLALTLAAGCSHLPRPHWPWHHQPAQGPQEVHELDITSADGSSVNLPQYWKRNTLVVDLQRAGATGSVVMKPREH